MSGMIADYCRNLGRVGKIETLPILQICPPSSQTIGNIYDFEFSIVKNGRETVKSQTVWDFPDIWKPGFKPKRSGILLFPDRPRFCRLMKTRNRIYPRSSGMNEDTSGESGAFLLPDASQISAMVGDSSWQMKTQNFLPSKTSASVGDGFRLLPIHLIAGL